MVAAVIAELVIAWIEPPYNSFLTLSAIADAIIALGITVEVVLGTMWNNHIQTELRRRSNEQLGSVIKAAAWRRLSEQESRAIFEAMRGHQVSIRIFHVPNDPESILYAEDISSVLRTAACTTSVAPDPYGSGRLSFGISLFPRSGDSGAADRVAFAFSNAGIDVVRKSPGDILALWIGSKPPPATEAVASPNQQQTKSTRRE